MARSKTIFDWIFGIDNQKGYVMHYLETSDEGLSPEALQARSEKEAASLVSVHRLVESHHSLYLVWKFLHMEHSLYTASKLVERAKSLTHREAASDLVRKSYGA
jgi:hypothetical protein